MAREGLHLPLREALKRAKARSTAVRVEGLKLEAGGRPEVSLEVIPLRAARPGEDHYLILFERAGGWTVRKERGGILPGEVGGTEPAAGKRVRRRSREELVEQELETTRKQLRSIMDEHEAAEEELRAANEEVLSANEELQSINEELETAKEELQSSNEELMTLNDELQDRNVALDELNNDLMNLFAGTNLPIIMLGRDLRLRRFTRMAEKQLKVTPASVGRSFLDLGLESDFPGLEHLIEETLETGEIREIEVRDRGGHWYSVQIRPYRTAENKIEGAVLAWVDTHALKMSLELARSSRDYEEAIVETVREGLLVLDEDMRVKTANRSFYQLFQTSPEQTENRLIFELGSGQWDVPELKRLLSEILPRDAAFQGLELTNDFDTVGPKVLRVNARRILPGSAAAPLILLAIEDITEQKREADKRQLAEQQLRQMQKLEAIGTLSGGIAHDLNNVFAPIILNAELGLMEAPPDSPLRGSLAMILKSGQRGRDLVRQLLLFARTNAPKSELVPLIPLIEETFRLLRSSIPSTIEMALRLETEADTIRGDPTQIQQVIMNLCANAAYALGDKKGSIDLTLRSARLGPADLPDSEMRPGDYLVLSVADTGVGMDDKVRRRIFEPFFTTKPTGKGAGLGLSVVHGIIKSHKGGITVSSEAGRGSLFKVFLPRAETATPLVKQEADPASGGQERILLVDDEEVLADSLRNMLQRLGYRVVAFTDSREALKVFLKDPAQFDLVLTDQTMPGLTGDELGRAIKRVRPDIPILLGTGYDDAVSSEKTRASGFQGSLTKPFSMRELAKAVRSALDRERPPKT
jgi:two-component system CheB/CheR fusion protein